MSEPASGSGGDPSTSGSRYRLKRGCSSLSIDNVCSACGKTFSAPHFLSRHQKLHCPQTTKELAVLREEAEAIHRSESKRRRLDGSTDPEEGQRNPGLSDVSMGDFYSSENGFSPAMVPGNTTNGASSVLMPEVTSPGETDATRSANYPTTIRALTTAENPMRDEAAGGQPSVSDASNAQRVSSVAAGGSQSPRSSYKPTPDKFGLMKRYLSAIPPTHDPDKELKSVDFYDSPNHQEQTSSSVQNTTAQGVDAPLRTSEGGAGRGEGGAEGRPEPTLDDLFAPFPNVSSFELGEWFYNQGHQKSLKDFKSLISIITNPDFSIAEIKNTKWTRVFQELGKNKEEIDIKRSQWVDDAGWKISDVEIEVPIHNRIPREEGRGIEKHIAGKLFHRSIVSILEEKIRNASDSRFFHYDGHELLWKPDSSEDSPEFRVLSELYHSDAFLEAQREVRESPPPEIKDCKFERVVVGCSFWSDATHTSVFSKTKLWPLYLLFANESKYRRTSGLSDLCNHVAYFDALSDSFKDYITGRTGGKVPPNGFMAHLNREFFHAQWECILDDDLLKAIVEGIVIECSDGVFRRFFIRFFTYSADYPEKVLIATIKTRSDCPCVRCLVSKKNLSQMGTADDKAFREENPRTDTAERQQSIAAAREVIRNGAAVMGKPVARLLRHSDVPTENAFTKRLGHTGFDIFSSLVVDMLHEYEIGVFKHCFLHLLRVLEAISPGSTLVHELDRRFRMVPTFNQTIRKFSTNVSELKRRAARDYEDILQCAIPVFDGLLPEPLGTIVLELLYLNARWHALAKLRMQTEATVILLEMTTAQLGDQFRLFLSVTASIKTIELPAETERRRKSEKAKALKKSSKAPKEPKKSKKLKKSKNPATDASIPVPTTAYRIIELPSDEPIMGAGAGPSIAAATPTTTAPLARATKSIAAPAPSTDSSAVTTTVSNTFRIINLAPGQSTRHLTTGSTGPAESSASTAPIPVPPSSTLATDPDLTTAAKSTFRIIESSAPEHTPANIVTTASTGMTTAEPGSNAASPSKAGKAGKTSQPKGMNLSIIKFHALGHYAPDIRRFGPTDLYSTEWGEFFHRSPKAWTKRTSRRYLRKEITRHERRRMRLRKAKFRILLGSKTSSKLEEFKEQRLASRNPDIHHYISHSKKSGIWLGTFAQNGQLANDPASTNFIRELKNHLLPRFIAAQLPGITKPQVEEVIRVEQLDWSNVVLKSDKLYSQKIMRIKYTTYEARRNEDVIHLDTEQSNVMLLQPEYSYHSGDDSSTLAPHPFRYAKVIGILHAEVGYVGEMGRDGVEYRYHPLDVLWVRWYRPLVAPAGSKLELDKAELLPIDSPGSHSFVDPLDVLRACHIIPQFRLGRRHANGIGKSLLARDGLDWNAYYIGRFVDRDMFMRYEWGLAVGHSYTHKDAVAINQKIISQSKSSLQSAGTPRTHTPNGFDISQDRRAASDSEVAAASHDRTANTSAAHPSPRQQNLQAREDNLNLNAESQDQLQVVGAHDEVVGAEGEDGRDLEGEDDSDSDERSESASSDSDSGDSQWTTGYDSEDGREAALYGD